MYPTIIIALISTSVLVLSCFIAYYDENTTLKPEVDLAVCILSARENFDLRDAIRNTWLKDFGNLAGLQEMSSIANFIVGSSPCAVHPDYRVSPYSCHAWNPKTPANLNEDLAAFKFVTTKSEADACALTSISFLVMHEIKLKRVGILELLPFEQMDDIQVVLYDAVSDSPENTVLNSVGDNCAFSLKYKKCTFKGQDQMLVGSAVNQEM